MNTNSREFGTWSDSLVDKLSEKAYRLAYVREHVKTWIAYQTRALREQRGWLQGKLAEEMGKPQSVVSRIEDPDYGKLTLQTLFEVAAAFDVALIVKFVDYRTFLQQSRKVGAEDMRVDSFDPAALSPLPQIVEWVADTASQMSAAIQKSEAIESIDLETAPANETSLLARITGDNTRVKPSYDTVKVEHHAWH